MKLIEGYRSFLSSMMMTDKDDLILDSYTGKPVHFTYNKVKRRMALPTNAMIKKGMVDDEDVEVHAFHPLCEDVLRGESGTIRFLKRSVRYNFMLLTTQVVLEIVNTKASKQEPRSSEFTKFVSKALTGLKGVQWDAKLVKSAEKACEELLSDFSANMFNLYITNKVKVDDEMYLRVANVTTFMDELDTDGADFFGAKLERKIDKVVLYRLFEAVSGWMPTETGSNDACPYFGCIARAWHEYVRNYNVIARALRDTSSLKVLPQDWFTIINEMARYRNLIPTLPYNTGPRDGSTAAKPVVEESYGVGGPVGPREEAAPRASDEKPAGLLSISDLFGTNEPKKDYMGRDVTRYTLAEQEAIRSGRAPDGNEVLKRRIAPPPETGLDTVLSRVGLGRPQPRSFDDLVSGGSGSLFSGLDDNTSVLGGSGGSLLDSLRPNSSTDSDLNRSGGLVTDFFKR